MNQILKELAESCSPEEKMKIRKTREIKPSLISSDTDNLDLYTEKIHILEKGVLREIIIFIYRN